MKYLAIQNSLLIDALAAMSPDSSKATLRQWVKFRRVSVDGQVVSKNNYQVKAGETVALIPEQKKIGGDVTLIYQDPHIAVIDKPSSLLSVASDKDSYHCAHHILKRFYQKKIYVPHRLDQDTSGVMVFARTEEALSGLKSLFFTHNITRRYHAILEGEMTEKSGSWSSRLYEDSALFVRVTNDPNKGELAITHYEVNQVKDGYTWVTFQLETGKKNQIRVHSAHAGFPVAGDKKYGSKTNPIRRLCLHAYLLGFVHPVSGKEMLFESPTPWTLTLPKHAAREHTACQPDPHRKTVRHQTAHPKKPYQPASPKKPHSKAQHQATRPKKPYLKKSHP